MLKFKNFNLSYKKFNNCTQYSFIRELRLLETKNWKKKTFKLNIIYDNIFLEFK